MDTILTNLNSYQSLLWTVTCFFLPPTDGLRSWPCSDWILGWLFACWLSAPCPPSMSCSVSITVGWTPASYNSHTHFPSRFQSCSANENHWKRLRAGRGQKLLSILSLSLWLRSLSVSVPFSLSHPTPFSSPPQLWLSLIHLLVPDHSISPLVPPVLGG